MATNLYEVLGLDRNASPEQIRRAYRQRALQTHPDRQPPNASQADKDSAAERFQLVGNAYEVLNDPEKRRLYDINGVWPPPNTANVHQPTHNQGPSRSFDNSWGMPMHDPFFGFPFGSRSRAHFTDPFELFDSVFGSMRQAFNEPFFNEPFFDDPFANQHLNTSRGMGTMALGFPFGGNMFSPSFFGAPAGGRVYTQSTRRVTSPGSGWVSESRMTRTVNGVTETVWKRTNSRGEEHAVYTSPDGRERRTINGVEQGNSDPRYIEAPQYPEQRAPPPYAPPPPQGHAPPQNYRQPPNSAPPAAQHPLNQPPPQAPGTVYAPPEGRRSSRRTSPPPAMVNNPAQINRAHNQPPPPGHPPGPPPQHSIPPAQPPPGKSRSREHESRHGRTPSSRNARHQV